MTEQSRTQEDAAYVRDAVARFDQVGFDDGQPSISKHRILQAPKSSGVDAGRYEKARPSKNRKD